MKSANQGLSPRTDRHEEVLPEVVDALKSAQRVLCVIHAGPDGDAAGSSLALGLALSELGKDVTFFCHTGVPWNLTFLPGLDRVVSELAPDARFDVTTVCDASASHRVGPGLPERERLGTFLNIDHHLTNDDFGDINYVDAGAAAVGVLIARILKGLGHPPSKDVAIAIFTSVLTDTGSFRYSSTNPEALRVAADMVAAGADPWSVSSEIYEQSPVERLHLLKDALGSLDVSNDGLLACITITHAMTLAAGGRAELTSGFINFARGIRGVEVACQLNEPAPGTGEPWSISFRSRGRVDVARVAASFGGGGHRNAAGARITGTLDEIRRQIALAVEEQFHAGTEQD